MYDIFYVSKKTINEDDWKVISSRYPTIKKLENITSIDQIKQKAFTKMFWIIWDNTVLEESFDLRSYRAAEWDNEYIHTFLNGSFYDGICLFPKCLTVSDREFANRFFINNKKEINIQASHPKPYDIIFVSYNEINADQNFENLKTRFPRAKRVHGVKGIHQAHIKAAELATTDMLWVVDADAIIVDDFDFIVEQIPYYSNNARRMLTTTVHVWRSRNPINGLEYGYGGVKLLPRQLTLDMDVNSADMTTSISKLFKAMPSISNITAFNTDAFSSWRSAFRECVKLSSKIIDGQVDDESQERLTAWCKLNQYADFGLEAYQGALAGVKYGKENKDNLTALKKINDFDWLRKTFNEQ